MCETIKVPLAAQLTLLVGNGTTSLRVVAKRGQTLHICAPTQLRFLELYALTLDGAGAAQGSPLITLAKAANPTVLMLADLPWDVNAISVNTPDAGIRLIWWTSGPPPAAGC